MVNEGREKDRLLPIAIVVGKQVLLGRQILQCDWIDCGAKAYKYTDSLLGSSGFENG
jgi:hypothetical protein